MADDDEAGDEAISDPTFDPRLAKSGPRRSTFTPPLGGVANSVFGTPDVGDAPPVNTPLHDDDELARALADDFSRVAPPTAPIPTPTVDAMPPLSVSDPGTPMNLRSPDVPIAGGPVAGAPTAPPLVGSSFGAPAPGSFPSASYPQPQTSANSGPESWGGNARDPDTDPDTDTDTDTDTDPDTDPDTATDSRPWLSAPAPDPAKAVDLSGGPLLRPVRRSLPDDQLEALVETAGQEPGGTLSVIEELESQLKLRESESRQFTTWQASMLALGTPDALAAIEGARIEFAGVVQVSPAVLEELPSADRQDLRAQEQVVPQERAAAPQSLEPPVFIEPEFAESPESAEFVEPQVVVEREVVEPELVEPEGVAEPEFVAPGFAEPPVFGAPVEPSNPPPLVEPSLFGVPATPAAAQPSGILEPTANFSEPASWWSDASGLPPTPQSTEVPSSTEVPASSEVTPPPLVSPPTGERTATAPNFDDLFPGAPVEERGGDPAESTPENIFIVPMAVAAGAPEPTDTDSIRVIEPAVQAEIDDEVDETDRVFSGFLAPGAAGASASSAALFAAQQVSPPSAPIPITRIPVNETVIADSEPVRQRVFSLELSGLEPTPIEQRVGRSSRLFWLWFAANSSILSLALGATIFGLGVSLRQAIVAVLAGVALSFLPLGLATLAGKRSGQPTMVVSRATFGVIGNVVPAILALVTRVFWGAVLLWLLATATVIILVGAELDGALGEGLLLVLALAVGLLVAVLIAVTGFALLARIQLILSIITALLLIGLVVMTASYINVEVALATPDGPWILSVTGAVLVFSFVGLTWANSGGDLARYQRPGTSGASSMLWATFGSTLPSFLIIGYGALLAASNSGIASGFTTSPLDTLSLMLPSWYPVPLLLAAGLSLLSGLTITLYSGGFAFQAIGVRLPRYGAVLFAALLVAAVAVLIAFGGVGGITELFRDVATTLAVPTAAWSGIFAAEMMIRNRRFESGSLLARGGVYSSVHWVNLSALIVISAIGFGLTSATVSWLGWQGYLFGVLGISLETDLAGTDLGVLVALALGLLVPIAFGVPSIRRQEAAKV